MASISLKLNQILNIKRQKYKKNLIAFQILNIAFFEWCIMHFYFICQKNIGAIFI